MSQKQVKKIRRRALRGAGKLISSERDAAAQVFHRKRVMLRIAWGLAGFGWAAALVFFLLWRNLI